MQSTLGICVSHSQVLVYAIAIASDKRLYCRVSWAFVLHSCSRKLFGGKGEGGGEGVTIENVLPNETFFFPIILFFLSLQLRSSHFSPVLRIWCFFPSHRKNLPLSNFWWNRDKLSETKPYQRKNFVSISLRRYYHHWFSVPLKYTPATTEATDM